MVVEEKSIFENVQIFSDFGVMLHKPQREDPPA